MVLKAISDILYRLNTGFLLDPVRGQSADAVHCLENPLAAHLRLNVAMPGCFTSSLSAFRDERMRKAPFAANCFASSSPRPCKDSLELALGSIPLVPQVVIQAIAQSPHYFLKTTVAVHDRLFV